MFVRTVATDAAEHSSLHSLLLPSFVSECEATLTELLLCEQAAMFLPLLLQVRQSLASSLHNLGTDYIDSLVLHSPMRTHDQSMTGVRA